MSTNLILLLITIIIGVGFSYFVPKISKLEPQKRRFAESCVVGILVCFTAYLLFTILIYWSSSYQRVVFREIARNNNAVGNLSIIILSVIALIIFGFFVIHSIRETGSPIAKIQSLFFPNSNSGKKLVSISIVLFVIIGAESAFRKFYVREMVAYYNQMVSIADNPNFSEKPIIRRFFHSKLGQIDSMGQFYAIEKCLKLIIEKSDQELPKRLREKFTIGDWKPYDSLLNAMYPRSIKMDEKFYNNLISELHNLLPDVI